MADTEDKTENRTAANKADSGKTKKGPDRKILLGAAAVIILAGLVFVAMNFGNVAKAAAERIASDTLGVKVTIGGLDIKLKDQEITVTRLRVGNPDGFKSPYAFDIGEIAIRIDNISKELLDFDRISVSDSTINLDISEKGTNLTALKNKAQARQTDKPEKAVQPKVIIADTRLTGTTINTTTMLDGGEPSSFAIDRIDIDGIGQRSNGVLASEAIVQVLNGVTRDVVRRAAAQDLFEGMSADTLEDMGVGGSVVDRFREQAEGFFKR